MNNNPNDRGGAKQEEVSERRICRLLFFLSYECVSLFSHRSQPEAAHLKYLNISFSKPFCFRCPFLVRKKGLHESAHIVTALYFSFRLLLPTTSLPFSSDSVRGLKCFSITCTKLFRTSFLRINEQSLFFFVSYLGNF